MSHSLQIKETATSEVDLSLQVMAYGNSREEKLTESSSLVEEPLTSTTYLTLQKARQQTDLVTYLCIA
jgi:hypothetical protein